MGRRRGAGGWRRIGASDRRGAASRPMGYARRQVIQRTELVFRSRVRFLVARMWLISECQQTEMTMLSRAGRSSRELSLVVPGSVSRCSIPDVHQHVQSRLSVRALMDSPVFQVPTCAPSLSCSLSCGNVLDLQPSRTVDYSILWLLRAFLSAHLVHSFSCLSYDWSSRLRLRSHHCSSQLASSHIIELTRGLAPFISITKARFPHVRTMDGFRKRHRS